MKYEYAYPTAQRGMALVLSLIFLAIVTLVSLSSMQGSITQGRMALNQQDYSLALQASENALYEAEKDLKTHSSIEDFRNVTCLDEFEPSKTALKKSAKWLPNELKPSGQTSDSYYCIELIADLGSHHTSSRIEIFEFLFRINSVGFGKAEHTTVILESSFILQQQAGVEL